MYKDLFIVKFFTISDRLVERKIEEHILQHKKGMITGTIDAKGLL